MRYSAQLFDSPSFPFFFFLFSPFHSCPIPPSPPPSCTSSILLQLPYGRHRLPYVGPQSLQKPLLTLLADPILQQVPLIRNPSFQPPKTVTLNANYSKLLATLPTTVIPPKMNLTKADLESWIADLHEIDSTSLDEAKSQADIAKYTDWVESKQRKVAPGFNFDIMKPTPAGQKE